MNLSVRFRVEYVVDGTVLHGAVDQRQFGVCTARVVMTIDTERDLVLAMHPDIAEYSYSDNTLELLLPLLSSEWIVTPLPLSELPILRAGCETDEIQIRVVTPKEERIFRATHVASPRWLSDAPHAHQPPAMRDRLLIPIGRAGDLRLHPSAATIQPVREQGADAIHVVVLENLVIPPRSTCIFCEAPTPTSREHVVPNWARPEGAVGITVAACNKCNGALSTLEDAVSQISAIAQHLSTADRVMLGMWSVKTIWVIGKSLDMDPLRGAGDLDVAYLTGRAGSADHSTTDIVEIYSTIEPENAIGSLQFTAASPEGPWAMLRIRNLLTTVRLK